MASRTLRALLCDLDGTLADTEPLHCTAWLGLLADEYDLHYDEHWFEQWIGKSEQVVGDYLVAERKIPVSARKVIDQKQARFHEAVRREGKLFAGVADALVIISAHFPLAIATNSGRADADLMIEATGLERFTATSVTASDVDHVKPAPDIYLLAAERLDVPAAECIAIEDSGPGGESALAAGCYLIGLTKMVKGADEYAETNAAALQRALELLQKGSS